MEDSNQPILTTQMNEVKNDDDDTRMNKKTPLVLTTTLFLRSLDIDKREFTVAGRIDGFWKDKHSLNAFEVKDDDNYAKTIKYSNLSAELQKKLPFQATAYDLLHNVKSIKCLNDSVINVHSNGIFHFNIPIEATIAQNFDTAAAKYPHDKHILTIKLFYNHQYKLCKLHDTDEEYILSYYKSMNIPHPKEYISFSMDEFDDKQEWNGLYPWYSAAGDNYFFIALRVMRNPNRVIARLIAPLFIVIGCTFSIYGFPYMTGWMFRVFVLFMAFIVVTIIHAMKESKRLFKLIIAAYSVLALMLIGSIMTSTELIAGKADVKVTDAIDVVFAILAAICWLGCVLFNIYDWSYNAGDNANKQKYWQVALRKSLQLSQTTFIST